MTADIFSENGRTESDRMGIDTGEAQGPGASLTTSSEGSFSFSDSPPNATEMHVHFSPGVANGDVDGRQRQHGTLRGAAAPLTSCRHVDAAGRRGVLRA